MKKFVKFIDFILYFVYTKNIEMKRKEEIQMKKIKISVIAIISIILVLLPSLIWNNSKATDDTENTLDSWVDLKWTYSSVEKKEGTTKELKELLKYSKPEDLGTILFYSDGTYRVTKSGPITDIIEKNSQNCEFTSADDKMIIDQGQNKYVFQYNQEKNALIQNFDITVDGVKYEYILTMKHTSVITFSETYCKALEGKWVVSSVTKKDGTTKEFNTIFKYNTYEDLGTFTLNNDSTTDRDSTYSIKEGTFVKDSEYQGNRKYRILADRITLEKGTSQVLQLYYNEGTGCLETEYNVDANTGYKIIFKKVEEQKNDNNKNNSKKENTVNTDSGKKDSTTAKGQLPKTGKINLIVVLGLVFVLFVSAIIAYKNKDLK